MLVPKRKKLLTRTTFP